MLSGPRVAQIGFVAGALNGLIGIGGGIVMTPGLIAYGRTSPQVAVGTSLGAVVVLSFAAFVLHASFGGLSLSTSSIVVVVGAGMAGAQLGGWILARLTASWMLLLFSAFLLVMSVRLLIQAFGI